MMIYRKNQDDEQRQLAMNAILADISATYGVDVSVFSEEEINEIIDVHAKAVRLNEIAAAATEVTHKLVHTIEAEAKAREAERETRLIERDEEEMERVVSMVLIPMIDPYFMHRSPVVRKEIHDAVTDFYLVTTSIPCVNIDCAINALTENVNNIIKSH